jgi:predicted aldo/keto reductase-like oxidoreductase
MKTARGIGRMNRDSDFMDKLPKGTSPYNAMTRWLTTETSLTAAVIRVRNMEEFEETYSGAGKKLRDRDLQAMAIISAEADRTACRMCGKCQPGCPQQIPIADILRFERYAMDDNDWNKARKLYASLPTKGNVCLQCENCVGACPLDLNIPQKVSRVHAMLG